MRILLLAYAIHERSEHIVESVGFFDEGDVAGVFENLEFRSRNLAGDILACFRRRQFIVAPKDYQRRDMHLGEEGAVVLEGLIDKDSRGNSRWNARDLFYHPPFSGGRLFVQHQPCKLFGDSVLVHLQGLNHLAERLDGEYAELVTVPGEV